MRSGQARKSPAIGADRALPPSPAGGASILRRAQNSTVISLERSSRKRQLNFLKKWPYAHSTLFACGIQRHTSTGTAGEPAATWLGGVNNRFPGDEGCARETVV